MRGILFAIVALVIFTIFVTVFATAAPAHKVRVMPKWVWVLLCLVTTPIGGILYLTLGRPIYGNDAGTSGPATGNAGGNGARGSRTLAPDDDPDFLRNLAKRLKNFNLDDDSDGEQGKKSND